MVAGRYTLEREIGRGGMGAVWLAQDEVLGRQVAIKRVGMMPGSTDADLQRAEREGRLAAMLNHPNVVAVFDLVEDDDGNEHWLVMEYVDSLDLAALVRRDGPLSPDAAAPLVQQAAEALEAAHAAGIVHRDVKPSNFLVTPSGQAKLTDFGIARAHADPSLTRTGLVTGSPAYLAPEVAAGSSATPQSDVWGLGATMFHMLSGRPPYDVGDNLMGAMYRIVHEDPPRLDNAGWLGPLLDGTMTRDPEQRWSMADVKAFLASHGATTPLPRTGGAPPPARDPYATTTLDAPAPAPAPARSRRRQGVSLPTVLAGLLTVVLIVLLGLWWLNNDRDPTADAPEATDSPTQTQEPSPEPDEPTAEGMEQFIADYLATVTEDPGASFQMLTPAFQEESGGLQGYRGFWRTVRSASIR
ncbi:serine/threonine-protein kinase, partial [Nocardioides sp.]|uniref:serine/threonine-protein kinase n=1 Tax=Nocardioides sp. TaxID=35761 RepID=UPI0027346766